MERVTLGRVGRRAQMSQSRATIRSIDDKHLLQNVKQADGHYSETISNEGAPFERWQMVGMTAIPLKQFEDENKQQGGQQGQGQGQQGTEGFNDDQPKGKSAEAVMLFLNGSRSHPVAFVDDRRVRPYNMKEGDASMYHASGTEQKMYLSDQGAYVIANNNPSEEKNAQQKERYASLRHVNLQKQKHELKEDEEVQDHKHEGDSVNCEVRCTKDRIEFRAGDQVFGYYDKNASKWHFNGADMENTFSNTIKHQADNKITTKLTNPDQGRIETVGQTYLGLDQEDQKVPIGETDATRYKRTYVKLT